MFLTKRLFSKASFFVFQGKTLRTALSLAYIGRTSIEKTRKIYAAMKPGMFRRLMNLWPPFIGAGIKVKKY